MLGSILSFLQSLIEGGFLGQAVIATIIWGTIAVLLVREVPIDDRIFDGAFIVLGYFFHVTQVAATTHRATVARRMADDCADSANYK